MKKIKRNILLNPGPATTTDTVKLSLVVPDICPREKEFTRIMDGIRKDLVKIVQGDDTYTTVLIAGSGTAVMDSVVNSVVPQDMKIAVIVNGSYGERFVQIAKSYRIAFVPIEFEWGEKIDLDRVEDVLKNDRDISCIALVHHETTTGILNPINEIGRMAEKYNCIYIVDAISSFAGIPINIVTSRADFLLSTSNKCIQGMAGVAFAICKKSRLENIKNNRKRSFYLDLYSQYTSLEETGQTAFTPPVQVMYALKQAIEEYYREGGDMRYLRYSKNWRTLRDGLEKLGFRFLLPEEAESRLLITILEPESENFHFEHMHDYLFKKGFTIYPGKMKERTFRLATFGEIFPCDILEFLRILQQYLKENGLN